jgi:CRISPR-associated protein Cas2
MDQVVRRNRGPGDGGNEMDSYIVAYDIADPKRLRKVATICEDFGTRKQYSVFFCRLGATDIVRLRNRLYEVMNLEKDQVLFVPVCGKCVDRIESLGLPTDPPASRDVVIVT